MKLKSSPLTRSSFRLTAAAGVALAWCGWLRPAGHAQSPEEKPKTPRAYIRFWNLLPDGPGNNLVLLADDRKELSVLPPGNVFANYLPAPAGRYVLAVRRLDEKTGAIQRFPVDLPDQGYVTLLARETNGQPTVEMSNDTPDPAVKELWARLVLRQLFPGARVKVAVAGGPSSPSLGYGETGALENVPPAAQTVIHLQAVLPTVPPTVRNWTLTADFTTARHATLLLVADAYGRFRPRLAYDGPPAPGPAADSGDPH